MTLKYLQPVQNFFLTAATSVMLVLSFPPYDLSLCIFASFIPLYYLLFIKKTRIPMVWSFIAGTLYYALLLNWTGRFHYLSVPFISTVSGFLYFAVPLWISGKIINRAGPAWGFFALPSVWVLSEYLKTKGPFPFAFGIIGYSQHNNPAVIQAADIFGVYGISFLIVLVNYLAVYIIEIIMSRKKTDYKKALLLPVSASFIIIISILAYGAVKLKRVIAEEDLNIHLVQTAHDSKVPWMSMMDNYLHEYNEEISSASGKGTDLAVLPENSVKTFLSLDKNFQPGKSTEILNRLSSISRTNRAHLLFGGLEADEKEGLMRRYNTAFLFDRQGNLSGRYRKRVLVPFGEMNPLGDIFPFTDRVILGETDAIRLSSGSHEKIMKVTGGNGREYRFGVAICFEGTDGDLIRGYSLKEADFIVNITSDMWTRSGAALRQHALFGVFRAIENRLAYYRCGNGGISCVIDPNGKIVKELRPFIKGVLAAKLLILMDHRTTFYAAHGDWFIYLCMILLAVTVIKIKIRKNNRLL